MCADVFVFVGGWLAGARGLRAALQSSRECCVVVGGVWLTQLFLGCVGALLGVWDGTWLLFLAWLQVAVAVCGGWLWCGCVV